MSDGRTSSLVHRRQHRCLHHDDASAQELERRKTSRGADEPRGESGIWRGKPLKGKPQERYRHGTRPEGIGRNKASRGCENLKTQHSRARQTRCRSLPDSQSAEGAKNLRRVSSQSIAFALSRHVERRPECDGAARRSGTSKSDSMGGPGRVKPWSGAKTKRGCPLRP